MNEQTKQLVTQTTGDLAREICSRNSSVSEPYLQNILIGHLFFLAQEAEKNVSQPQNMPLNTSIKSILDSDQGPYEKLYNIKQLMGDNQ